VIEYREGADRVNTARKLPGLAKYPNVTLKRGITGSTDLFEWWKSVRDGQVQRRNVTITLLDEQRQAVLRWHLRDAWPVKIEGPTLNATGNEVAIETLELAHEGLEIE
jgi:phage tail-like protein